MKKINLARNTTFYTGALSLQKILAFIYFWLISNQLLADQLGQYVFALSFSTMFSIFVDLGISPILIREAAKNEKESNKYFNSIIGLKLPLTLATILAAYLVIFFSGKPFSVQILVYLACLVMAFDSFSMSCWTMFRARHNLFYESLTTIMVQIIIFTLGLTALKLGGDTKFLMLGLLGASIFNFCFVLWLLKFKLNFSLLPKFDWTIIKHFLKIVPAFFLAGIFVKIYNANDSILLSYLSSDQAVAYFAIPAKVIYSLQQIIPAAFAAAIFPTFSYLYIHNKSKLESTFEKAFAYLAIISLPLTAGILVLIPEVVSLFWPRYGVTIPTFYIMTLAIPFIFLTFPTGYLLNACDRQKRTTLNRGLITVLAVILNIILIPSLSYFGAGITFLTTNFILLFLDLYWVRGVIKIKFGYIAKVFLKSFIASLVMVGAIMIINDYTHLFVQVAFGGMVYFIFLYILKGINPKELIGLLKKEPQIIQD